MVLFLLDSLINYLAGLAGIPPDQIKLVVCLFLQFPLGFAFKRIHSSHVRLALGAGIGLFFEVYLYKWEVLHVVALSLSAYFLMKALKRKIGKLITFFALTYLSIYHIYRMMQDFGGWSMDISVTLMMTVPKVSAMAWCYEDGKRSADKLSADQEKRKLSQLPNIYEYMAYLFFYSTVIMGPFVDYKEFRDFIEEKNEYKNVPTSRKEAFRYIGLATVFIAVTTVISPNFPFEFLGTKEYAEKSFFYKILYLNISITLVRTKYFSAWYILNAGNVACGLSYGGKDKNGKDKWNRAINARFMHEFRDNIKDKLEDWNISVQNWLKKYVFFRVCSEEEGKKNHKKATLASNVAMMCSAFWHGYYTGYYMAFFHLFLLQQNSKFIYKAGDKFKYIIPEGPFRTLLKCVLTSFFLNHCGAFFVLLLIRNNIDYLDAVYYIPSILMVGTFIFFSVTGWGQRSPKAAAKEKSREMDPVPDELVKKTN